jgi:GST-like protein
MIDLYTWSTPNGRKISIALEEMGLAYEVHTVNINKDEQFRPKFLAISPNNKMPAIVDRDTGLGIFESGAILMYLGDKTGQLYTADFKKRVRVHEWLMWQMSAVGPMLGRAHYFLKFNAGKSSFAEAWFSAEAKRIYDVLDRLLETREFMCDVYSIADIATFPWIARHQWQGIDLNEYTHVKRWYLVISARPAVQKGYRVPDATAEIPMPK